MLVQVDRRSRNIRPAPAAEREAREAYGEIARAEARAARALAVIERSRCYVRSGFTSVHAWAADVGYGPQQVRRLLDLGRAFLAAPALESRVRTGKIAAESAVSVGRVLREQALPLTASEKAAWVQKAETADPASLRKESEKAVEEARHGAPSFPMRFLVTRKTRDAFRRARLLMSKNNPRLITEGETLDGLLNAWLPQNDPRLRPLPRRSPGATTKGVSGRYIPRRVRAIVERRSGGTCEICGVRRARQKIHLNTPHARGGSREAENLADSCTDCHVLVDAGIFLFTHFDGEGRPRWRCDTRRLLDLGSTADRVRERAPPYGVNRCESRVPSRARSRPRGPPRDGGRARNRQAARSRSGGSDR